MAKITDYTEKLRAQVERMNAHPYKETEYSDYYGQRYFKESLCKWIDLEELKDIKLNSQAAFASLNLNEAIRKILDSCRCDVFLFPDRGGYVYLMWNSETFKS